MLKYYDNFVMRFSTKTFTTNWHKLEVGIAAGCTISVVWFILVMEMLLMSADSFNETTREQTVKKAFMDDITLLSVERNPMHSMLLRLDALISWSGMCFKPKKSRSLTFVKGTQKEIRYRIKGETIPTVKEEPVKSLGRWYSGTLSDRSRGTEIQKQAEEGLNIIDMTKLPGKFKVWCLQFGLYPRLSWSLMIYEISLTRVVIIEQKCNVMLRKWLGLPKVANTTALYRKNGALQLPVTSVTEIYKSGKVRTVLMLKGSNDCEISCNPPEVRTAKKWNAEEEVEELISMLEHRDIIGAAQADRKGLGMNAFRPFSEMSTKERRTRICNEVKKKHERERELHLSRCAQQGQVLQWEEHVIERKISWKDIWKWNTSRISFLLASTYDILPSLTNLFKWKVIESDLCKCGKRATLKHILSNCNLSLERYTWRHNQVLKKIGEFLFQHLEIINSGKLVRSMPPKRIKFLKEGQQLLQKSKHHKVADDNWTGKWELSIDLPGQMKPFPIQTSLKPDIVIWNRESKIIRFVELTVSYEDNIEDAFLRKMKRYEELVNECIAEGWSTCHFPIEVGCRGYLGFRLPKLLKYFGFDARMQRQMLSDIQETAEKASHWIWLKRNDDSWFDG